MKNVEILGLNQKKIISDIEHLLDALWPLNRSITGKDTYNSLKILKNILPQLQIKSVPCGTRFGDWVVPPEWNVRDAYVLDSKKNKIIDWKINNLHLYGYSTPVSKKINKYELFKHISYLKDKPNAIPYVTSYYKAEWGFSISYDHFLKLHSEEYFVHINSSLNPRGKMHYGELYLPGQSSKEILVTTYICHPSLANNELSGPILSTLLFSILKNSKLRKYSLRLLILPETIGANYYIYKNTEKLKQTVLFGLVATCVGDPNRWSVLSSKYGNHLIDLLTDRTLNKFGITYDRYSFLDRGSDERQFSGPLMNMPMSSIMRSKYATYDEYHTSLDNLSFITSKAIYESLCVYYALVKDFEKDIFPKSISIGEPKFSNYGLKSTLSTPNSFKFDKKLSNVLTYCTGELTIEQIAFYANLSKREVELIIKKLLKLNLIIINSFPE